MWCNANRVSFVVISTIQRKVFAISLLNALLLGFVDDDDGSELIIEMDMLLDVRYTTSPSTIASLTPLSSASEIFQKLHFLSSFSCLIV
jgi:hypothetical protein